MEQAIRCEFHNDQRLIRVEGDNGPLLRCPEPRCEFRTDVPLDQRFRAAGLPTLFDRVIA